jgi:hypothetical protein
VHYFTFKESNLKQRNAATLTAMICKFMKYITEKNCHIYCFTKLQLYYVVLLKNGANSIAFLFIPFRGYQQAIIKS